MNIITIHDRKLTYLTSMGNHVLSKLSNVKIFRSINAEYYLEFEVEESDLLSPYDKTIQIHNDDYVVCDGQAFIVRRITLFRSSQKTYYSVYAEHVSYEMLDSYIIYREYLGKTIKFIVEDLIETYLPSIGVYPRFKASFPGTYTKTIDITLKDTNLFDAIKQICSAFDVELDCTNDMAFYGPSGWPLYSRWRFTLTFTKLGREYGTGSGENGVEFRFSKNMKSLQYELDASSIVNRLYVYGKNGLGIQTVNSGLAYIDANYGTTGLSDPTFPYPIRRVGYIIFDKESNPTSLLAKGTEHLAKVAFPKVTYSVDVLDLRATSPWDDFGIGDTVRVIDTAFQIDIKARIIEVETYPFEKYRNRLSISNSQDTISKLIGAIYIK